MQYKKYVVSHINILSQFDALEMEETYLYEDPRIPLMKSSLAVIELVRTQRILVEQNKVKVVSNKPLNDFILDAVLEWSSEGEYQLDDFLRSHAENINMRSCTSLIAQNVMEDIDGIVRITSFRKSLLREALIDALEGYSDSYPMTAVLSVLARVYDPNASLLFRFLNQQFDEEVMKSLYMLSSPWSSYPDAEKKQINMVLSSLYSISQ